MRILHVINHFGMGGAESMLVNIATAMAHQGHHVTVYTLQSKDNAMTQKLQQEGVDLRQGPAQQSVYHPRNIFLLKTLMKEKWDVIHAHLFPTQYWVAMAYKLSGSQALLVTTEHNTVNTRSENIILDKIDRKIYRFYQGIIGISDATCDMLRQRLKTQVHQIVQIDNGIDLSVFHNINADVSQTLPFLPTDAVILMQVARFGEQKNQPLCIHALQQLPANYHFVFVGDGEKRATCEALAREKTLSDRVHFLGIRNDVPQLLACADIVVMASHWEGFGLAAVEGMAMGKLVLASRVRGLAEVIGDDELLFDNSTQLAQKIIFATSNPNWKKAKEKALQARASLFDVSQTSRQYIDFYRSQQQK